MTPWVPPLSAWVLSRDLSHDHTASPRNSSTVPPPPSRPMYGGEGSLPPIHRPIGGWRRGCIGPRHTYRPGQSLYEGRMGTRGPSPLTHTTSYLGTRAFMWWRVRIALYNLLFARSIVTRRRGVGGKILPWGKGLIKIGHKNLVSYITILIEKPIKPITCSLQIRLGIL